uniref:Reverse transcriptase domain-containing protein n=1 Tax=Cannabis sativa TaxID=3483 RepID=A0A803PF19_CANSA
MADQDLMDLEKECDHITLTGGDDDDGGLLYDTNEKELSEFDDRWCLVGRFLTERTLDFMAMQHKMASLWRPGRGLFVKELEENLYLFQFYHPIDIDRVVEGSPWTFDRVPLVFSRLKEGEIPRSVMPNKLDFWIQLHGMSTGFMSAKVVKDIGNYVGTFVEADKNNFMGIWRDYLRVRVAVRVDLPLKRRMKLEKKGGEMCYANFKYEDLPTFCFICGILGHSEKFCPKLFDTPPHLIKKPYSLELKAMPRRRQHTIGSRWLRQGLMARVEDSGDCGGEASGVKGATSGGVIGGFNQGINMAIPRSGGLEGGHNGVDMSINADKSPINDQGKPANYIPREIGMDEAINEDMDGDLIVIDSKRKRLANTLLDGPIEANGESTIRTQREDTWNLIKSLVSPSNDPWCIIGDLNNVLSQSDKKGGLPYPNWLITGFEQTLSDCDLVDMELVGYPYTWEKGRGTSRWIEVRLDRALVSLGWYQYFSHSRLLNIETSPSDHNPILLEFVLPEKVIPNRRFRFENAWLKEPMCLEIVKDCWNDTGRISVAGKIALCAEKLSKWGSNITGNFKLRINKCKTELKRLKNHRDDLSVQRYSEIKKELFLVLDQKEAFWKQRAKQFWLKEGDQNSKYFHRAASNRRSFNQISKLKDASGHWKDWDTGLADVVVDYFSSLFSASNLSSELVIQCIQQKVTSQINEELQQPVLTEEVKRAVFSMHPDKSPGPDGMTPAFYQKCWEIVHSDVTAVVQHFFDTGEFDQGCGDANVVLIPKKKTPESMVDLRPIALCNVLYKIITKVMANRMKPYMDQIVSESQSAFIPGRLITDNILVSFEVLHYLKRKRKGKEGFMALKLDLSKAYDRIEWKFLDSVLRKIGFSELWISLVLKCVNSAKYNVVHGGRTMGPITPSRGIRQGDPLSPYIFILCAEGLSTLIKRYEDRGLLHGCKVANGAPKVSHMLFADDSYLYCKATLQEATRVRELLHQFECASGQKVNLGKSSIFYSTNTANQVRKDINMLLQMPQADDRSMYLGLPSTMGRNKSAVLGFLKDRVRKKLQGWDAKVLSRAGKEVLIKSVAQALPSYAMNVFLLPLEISRDIESTMARFWWKSSSKENKGIPWMSWERMCHNKENGGLGFRNLHDFNLALLGKQGWRFMTRPESLVSRIFKARYFPNGNYLSATLGNNPSFVWRSVWEAQSLIRAGARWKVGNGTLINILNEPWLPDQNQPFVTSSHPALHPAKVCNLLKVNELTWDEEILQDLFDDRDQLLIKRIPLIPNQPLDFLYWCKEAAGNYTVKSAYQLIQSLKGVCNGNDASVFWKSLWSLKLPPKIKNLMWRAGSNCLPTLSQLASKFFPVNTKCPLCDEVEETISHILLTCRIIKQVWERVGIGTLGVSAGSSFLDWCVADFSFLTAEKQHLAAALCWAIWGARNDVVWQKKSINVSAIVVSAKSYLDQWQHAQKTQIETSWTALQSYDGSEHWLKPQFNSIKINVDAAIFEGQSRFGSAFVVRDHNGLLIEGHTKLYMGNMVPAVVEALSFREALSWIKDHSHGPV